jgi:hypothetical protein
MGNGCNCASCGQKDCGVDDFCCVDKHGNLSCQATLSACK